MMRKGFPEYVIFASGYDATKHTLHELNCLRPGIVNSAILFNPTLDYGKTGQNIPRYSCISNRVYNFSTKKPGGVYRKIFPAPQRDPAAWDIDRRPYFKGINICTLLIGQEGKEIDDFSFSDLDLGKFGKIIDTIDISNRYRLQPDLNTIIANNTSDVMRANTQKSILTSTPADLPIVTVRHAVEFIEYPPNTQPQCN